MSHQIERRLAILHIAHEMLEQSNGIENWALTDRANKTVEVSKILENYLTGDIQVSEDSGLAARKAFLDSIESNICGRGKEGCDGSEGTCTCQ